MAARRLKPRREPSQERARETVRAILEAAAQVFERYGYAAGTTNRIAERAGISIGSLYQYFPSKDAILVALTEQHLERGRELVAPLLTRFVAEPPPVADGLRELTRALIDLHADEPSLHRVLFEECPRPPELRERLERAFADAAVAVAAWLARRPEVTVSDPLLAAELVVQTIDGVTHRLVIGPRPSRPVGTYADETVLALERYLTGGRTTAGRS